MIAIQPQHTFIRRYCVSRICRIIQLFHLSKHMENLLLRRYLGMQIFLSCIPHQDDLRRDSYDISLKKDR